MAQERPLSDEEIHAIREIIKKDERMKWLGAGIRNLAVWVVGVLTGIVLLYETLMKVLKGILEALLGR